MCPVVTHQQPNEAQMSMKTRLRGHKAREHIFILRIICKADKCSLSSFMLKFFIHLEAHKDKSLTKLKCQPLLKQ
jgi:hypothetical protein